MRTLGIIAAISVALYAAYAFAFPSVTVRYRLALTVEADGVEHTGSCVIQVTYGKNVRLMGASGEIYIEVKGEAVAVDIPGRGTLFAVLKAGEHHRSSPEWIVPKAFGFPGGGIGSPPEPSFDRLRALKGRVELAPGDLPLLVRFRDINDPKTVERVDPNDLAASFGPGAYLKRATIEITRDPVTTDIEKRLSWLGSLRSRGASLDGDTSVARSSNALANVLGPGSFQAGAR
jgi:hypothetical protein